MKDMDLRGAFPTTPPVFHQAMEQTLAEVEQMKGIKPRLRLGLVAALVAALALAGVGYAAAVHWKLFDSRFIAPLDAAGDAVVGQVGTARNGDMIMTVSEAAYDGFAVYAVVDFTLTDPKTSIFGVSGNDLTPEMREMSDYWKAEYDIMTEAKAQGKRELKLINIDLDVFVEDGAGDRRYTDNIHTTGSYVKERVGDGVRCTMMGLPNRDDLPQQVELQVRLGDLIVRSPMERVKPIKTSALVPTGQIEGIDIVSSQIVHTDFAAYLDLTFVVQPEPACDEWLDFWHVKMALSSGGQQVPQTIDHCSAEIMPGGRQVVRYRGIMDAAYVPSDTVQLDFFYEEIGWVGSVSCQVQPLYSAK